MKLQVLCAKYLGDTIPEKLILISFSYHYHVRLRNILYRAAYESERLIRGLYNTLISHVANRVNIRGSEKRPSSSCYLRDERKKKRRKASMVDSALELSARPQFKQMWLCQDAVKKNFKKKIWIGVDLSQGRVCGAFRYQTWISLAAIVPI